MIELFAVTVISCSDAMSIVLRLTRVIGLSYHQKVEVIHVLQKYIPSCPIIIDVHGKSK